jgi:hypothetical protein
MGDGMTTDLKQEPAGGGARFSHEWDVVGEPGSGRFVESDEGGAPFDNRRYKEFRAAEARGELVYLGVRRHEPGEQVGSLGLDGAGDADTGGRSYRDDLMDGSAVSRESLAGDMGLFRDG